MINSLLHALVAYQRVAGIRTKRSRVTRSAIYTRQTLFVMKHTACTLYTRRLYKVFAERAFTYKKQRGLSLLASAAAVEKLLGKPAAASAQSALLTTGLSADGELLFATSVELALGSTAAPALDSTIAAYALCRVASLSRNERAYRAIIKLMRRALAGLKRFKRSAPRVGGVGLHRVRSLNQRLSKLRALRAALLFRRRLRRGLRARAATYRAGSRRYDARHATAIAELASLYNDQYFIFERLDVLDLT